MKAAFRPLTSIVLLCLLSLCSAGCGDSSSPTEPDADYHLALVGDIKQVSYRQTMLRVQMRLDGDVVRDYSSNTAFSDIIFSATASVGGGQHRLELRIVDQTSSPNSYRLSATVSVIDHAGNYVKDINLPEKTESLATGQGVTYTFSI